MRLVRTLCRMLCGPALVAAMLAVAPSAWGQATSAPPAGSFSAGQRQEIIAIIREALRSDASLLRDAIAALQEDEARQKSGATRGVIAELGQALTRTPGDPVAGNPKGDVTVVEFYDVRCPYCRRMVPVIAELIRRDPGVRVVYKDFPILGPASTLGARALLAAHKQGGYLKLHTALMTGAPNLDQDALRGMADRVGLDWDRLQRDMGDPDIMGRINANLALGRRLDLQGTPAYVIGEHVLPGAVDLSDLLAAVAAARSAR
ncbi:MAG: DsbA family protein [Acetobacteraceae bacterium]|nr:DsbA family protein [Acetobacteraceae bacterium]